MNRRDYEELGPARFDWKQYAIKFSIENSDLNDWRVMIKVLMIRNRIKKAQNAAFRNITAKPLLDIE